MWADVWELWTYWADNPPPHILQANGVGAGFPMKRVKRRASKPTTAENSMLQMPAAKSTDAFPASVQQALREMRKSLNTKQ